MSRSGTSRETVAERRQRSDAPTVDAGRVILGSGVAALVGGALLLLGGSLDLQAALFAYLTAFAFALTVALGALALVMIGHVTGARWFVSVRRIAEAVAGTLPLFVLLVIPLLVWMPELYPWARPLSELPAEVAQEVAKKSTWLNPTFFTVRSLFYVLVWAAMAGALWRWSVAGDRQEGDMPGHPVLVSGPGFPVYGFTLTFASFDWLMSLQPTWHSTIFGLYLFAGGMVGALAVLSLLAWGMGDAGLLPDGVAESHYYAAGRLLLTFVILWTYFAYSQAFIIWIGDLPSDVQFYLARWDGGWSGVLILLMVGHFGFPFFALLSRDLKRKPRRLGLVAGWLLLMHWVDMYWLVVPALGGRGPWPGWQQAAAFLAVVGAVTCFGAWRLRGHAPWPVGDPRLDASLGYTSR